jgi:hypothetical protein
LASVRVRRERAQAGRSSIYMYKFLGGSLRRSAIPSIGDVVSTDRSPHQYAYLSQRLLHLLHEQDAATRSSWRPSKGALSLGPLQAEAEPRDRQNNLFGLTDAVTQAVYDQTGTLEHPGLYVRDTMNVRLGVLPVLRGEAANSEYRMALVLGAPMQDASRIDVILYGSLNNYLGVAAPAEAPPLVWWPSDDVGFERYTRALAYGNEERADFALVDDQYVEESTVSQALRVVNGLSRGAFVRDAVLEVLFLVFDQDEVHEDGVSRRVYVGTPLWVRTPAPQRDARLI